jgi:hypothetical protein
VRQPRYLRARQWRRIHRLLFHPNPIGQACHAFPYVVIYKQLLSGYERASFCRLTKISFKHTIQAALCLLLF